MTTPSAKPAVFFDRDNTIIRDPGYLRDPDQVHLLDGAAESIARLRAEKYSVVVVTNQSGVARGYLTEEEVGVIHRRMQALLADQGTMVDAIYYCPYLDGIDAVRTEYRVDSDLRKPKPGMLLLAAREHQLDLPRSWMIGDSERDVVAGKAAGCRTILLQNGGRSTATVANHVVENLSSAVEIILNNDHANHAPDTSPPTPSQVPNPSAPRAGGSDHTLHQIIDELRLMRRENQYTQFSFAQLAGAIAQAFALCALGWGIYAAINGADESAKIRLLVAIAFQLLALTGFSATARK